MVSSARKLKGGKEANRGWDGDGITNSMDLSLSKLREMVKDREAGHAKVHGITKSQTRLSDWTTTCWPQYVLFLIWRLQLEVLWPTLQSQRRLWGKSCVFPYSSWWLCQLAKLDITPGLIHRGELNTMANVSPLSHSSYIQHICYWFQREWMGCLQDKRPWRQMTIFLPPLCVHAKEEGMASHCLQMLSALPCQNNLLQFE